MLHCRVPEAPATAAAYGQSLCVCLLSFTATFKRKEERGKRKKRRGGGEGEGHRRSASPSPQGSAGVSLFQSRGQQMQSSEAFVDGRMGAANRTHGNGRVEGKSGRLVQLEQ